MRGIPITGCIHWDRELARENLPRLESHWVEESDVSPQMHRVVKGETLSGIAIAYDVPLGHLAIVNSIRMEMTGRCILGDFIAHAS